VSVPYASFDEWWEPYTLGVGPAGEHVASLSDQDRDRLRAQCRAALPAAPFTVDAAAWAVCSTSSGLA
jgi:hypothetical protein